MLMQAAADTLAMSSLEVDLSNIQEGQTVTVKWRGKPVFIRHRCAVADSSLLRCVDALALVTRAAGQSSMAEE